MSLLGAKNKVYMQETVKLPETINLIKHSEYLKPVHPSNKDQKPLTRKHASMICRKGFYDKANLNRHLKNVPEKESNWRTLALFHFLI